ncbi:tyrosine-type recombinase/integrase [Butyricicoccus intestinisimiae]|jgi:integrase/recombinase XerD|uniref:tyrosine-type recombinase/integrase n=1 Tax=Butyricicoccus intestinisimiae TaxID=2841509 RepID=UPI003D922002
MEESTREIDVRPFNQYRPEFNENSISKATEDGRITPEDARVIREFIGTAQGEGLSPARIRALTSKLVSMRRYIPPYPGITYPQLMQGVGALRTGHYAQSTVQESLKVLKKFVRFLMEYGYTEITEAQLKKIRIENRYEIDLTPSDILTKEEILRLIQACRNPRDRALIALTYESGGRISEVCDLRWKDITIEETGIAITTRKNTKKEKRRYIRCVWCRPYVAEWLSNYPVQPIPDDAPIFVTEQLKSIRYGVYRHQFNRILKRSGIEKKITLHDLRHARVTHLSAEGLSESVIKLMIWGDVGTSMLGRYQHLSNQDIDRQVREMYGLAEKNSAPDPMTPRQCTRCYLTNKHDAHYCNRCGAALTEDARRETVTTEDDLTQLAAQNPDPDTAREIVETMVREALERAKSELNL